MRKHPEGEAADRVLTALRDANPVPRSGVSPEPEQVSRFLLEVTERTEMVQDISQDRIEVDRPIRKRRLPGSWLGFAAGFAVAMLIAVPVLLTMDRDTENLHPATTGLAPQQAKVVSDVLQAFDEEDYDAFRDAFSDDGGIGLEAGLIRPYHQGISGGQEIPVSDREGFEANFLWFAALDTRVDLTSCQAEGDRIVECEATVTQEALRSRYTETWAFALDRSGKVTLLLSEPSRPTPLPVLPNGDETLSAFEAWLAEEHPDDYRRVVDPGTPGEINGVTVRWPVDMIDDVTALIDEYLAR